MRFLVALVRNNHRELSWKLLLSSFFSVDLLIGTVFEPFGAMVLFNTDIKRAFYFDGVRLRLRTRDGRMLLSSIFFDDAMQLGFFELFLKESEMGTFPVVPSLLTKPILLNKLCAQHDCLRSMWSSFSSGYRLIRAMATDSAMLQLTAPPRPRTSYNEFFFWKMNLFIYLFIYTLFTVDSI